LLCSRPLIDAVLCQNSANFEDHDNKPAGNHGKSVFMKKILPLFLLLFAFAACRKDSFITSGDARVTVTTDSLKYDTVFTRVGSVTKSFKIINDNDRRLRLNSVKLMGGNSSAFKMNVDGTSAPEVNSIEINANDSIYVFVQVNVDPAAGGLPFIISDSIQIDYNGNTRKVQLQAWGQNAHFLRGHEITADETWNNDLPYVILDYLYVAENIKLKMNKGCRVYMHANAPVIIDGTLEAIGDKDTADRIKFQGDRLDLPYRDYPASWPGIYFRETSRDNIVQYAFIRHAYQAIVVQGTSLSAQPKLRLYESVIDNAYDIGLAGSGSSIEARNCLLSNCGRNVVLTGGGTYRFTHCTAVSISNNYVPHKEPVLSITNNTQTGAAALDASFTNCIFWGEGGLVENEVLINRNAAAAFTVNFDHGLWKLATALQGVTATSMLTAQEPGFETINSQERYYDFRLKEGATGLEAGRATSVNIDLDGKTRPVGLPDLGCFERR